MEDEFLTRDQAIDEVLSGLNDGRGDYVSVLELCEGLNYYVYENKLIRQMIIDNGFAVSSSTSDYVTITKLGAEIVESGGWIKELERRVSNNDDEKYRKQIELEHKLEGMKLTKLQRKMFWPLVALSVIGGVCGIISLALKFLE